MSMVALFHDGLRALATFQPSPNAYIHSVTSELLRRTFTLGRFLHWDAMRDKIRSDLAKSRDGIVSDLPAALNQLNSGGAMECCIGCLDPDHLYLAKIYRSALQFLHEDIFPALEPLSPSLLEAVEKLYEWREELDERIEWWSNLGLDADPDGGMQISLLEGVPESHNWWTQANREGRN